MLIFLSTLCVEKPCALFCSPVGKEQPILLSEKVMDGTSCGYQGLDVCANGRCQVRHSRKETVCAEGGFEQLHSVMGNSAPRFKSCGES